jgi:hypothetical protein
VQQEKEARRLHVREEESAADADDSTCCITVTSAVSPSMEMDATVDEEMDVSFLVDVALGISSSTTASHIDNAGLGSTARPLRLTMPHRRSSAGSDSSLLSLPTPTSLSSMSANRTRNVSVSSASMPSTAAAPATPTAAVSTVVEVTRPSPPLGVLTTYARVIVDAVMDCLQSQNSTERGVVGVAPVFLTAMSSGNTTGVRDDVEVHSFVT